MDVTCEYLLATAANDVTFNVGEIGGGSLDDIFLLTRVRGLDGAPRRTVSDRNSFTDGETLHSNLKAARHPAFEGVFLIQSVRQGVLVRERRNEMWEELFTALEAAGDADASLTWTPFGLAERSLTVRDKGEYAADYDEEYRLYTFSFGLIAPTPDW